MRILIIITFTLSSLVGLGQSNKLTVQQAIDVALKNNAGIKTVAYEVESQRQLKKTGFDLPKTSVSLQYGQYNSFVKNDNNITIAQSIPFAVWGSQVSLNRSLLASSELKKAFTENELVYQVKQVYYQLAFVKARHELLLQQDSIYEGFLKSASLRYKTGETKLLEQATAETQRNEVKNQLRQNESTATILRTQLQTLLNSERLPDISENGLTEIPFDVLQDTALSTNPFLSYVRQQVEVAKSLKKVETAKFAPDLSIGYFNQTLIDAIDFENGAVASSNTRFTGFQVGVSIPLWFIPHQGRVKAAEFNRQAAESNYTNQQKIIQGQSQQAAQLYGKNRNSLEYYRSSALPNAELILKQSQIAFRGGEIGYAEYLLGVRNAISIKEGYLQTLSDYNQSIIYIEFLSGTK
ncbi:MAG: TolC family protein [Cyclobacteriaceae bacterium]|nr:TolC family protein [Cyclobacteriaceae bacterium]